MPLPRPGPRPPSGQGTGLMRTAVIHHTTTAVNCLGVAEPIFPGRYRVLEVDGAAGRGEMFVVVPATLVRVNPDDGHITVDQDGTAS